MWAFPGFCLVCVLMYMLSACVQGVHTLMCVPECGSQMLYASSQLFSILFFETRPCTEPGACPFAWDYWRVSTRALGFFLLSSPWCWGYTGLCHQIYFLMWALGHWIWVPMFVFLVIYISPHSSPQVSKSDNQLVCFELCTGPDWLGRAEKMSGSEFCLGSGPRRLLLRGSSVCYALGLMGPVAAGAVWLTVPGMGWLTGLFNPWTSCLGLEERTSLVDDKAEWAWRRLEDALWSPTSMSALWAI